MDISSFKRWFNDRTDQYESSGDDFFLPDLCGAQNLLFIVLIAELLAVVLVLFDVGFADFSWSELGLTSLFVQWLVLTGAGLLCNTRTYLKDLNIVVAILLAYGMIVIVALIVSVIAEITIRGFQFNMAELDWLAISNRVLISAILAGLAFRYLWVQHQLIVQEQAELGARIQALQSRIRPHFLFNSMNIIASLIEVDPVTAERVVEDLSVLFRASLSESSSRPVSLEDEISLCEKYTGIEVLRLGDRLQVEWNIDVDVARIEIPMLTLQPLLENAIYHGIQPLPEGGVVTVDVTSEEEMVLIRVTNPISDENRLPQEGNRMAVENIRYRLRAIYGPSANIQSEAGEGVFETVITYPMPPVQSP